QPSLRSSSDLGALLVVHSFPTRRSSDLRRRTEVLLHWVLPHPRAGRSSSRRWMCGSTGTPSQRAAGCLPYILYRNRSPRGSDNRDRKSTRLNSSHVSISYAVFCLKKERN